MLFLPERLILYHTSYSCEFTILFAGHHRLPYILCLNLDVYNCDEIRTSMEFWYRAFENRNREGVLLLP
jgi:hypothetical protein